MMDALVEVAALEITLRHIGNMLERLRRSRAEAGVPADLIKAAEKSLEPDIRRMALEMLAEVREALRAEMKTDADENNLFARLYRHPNGAVNPAGGWWRV